MTETKSLTSKKQDIVYLDVGGHPFKILKSTVLRYPNSLLGRMLNEFHNLGEKDDPLFIDRSPKAFPWILEIYRDGDHTRCIPDMSPGFLRRELDFYQLPIQAALEAETPKTEAPLTVASCFKRSKRLNIAELADEMARCGLEDLWPMDVFIYYHFESGSNEKTRKLYLRPSLDAHGPLPCNAKEHSRFNDVLYGRRPIYSRERFSDYVSAFKVDLRSLDEESAREDEVVDDFIILVKTDLDEDAASIEKEMGQSGWSVIVKREDAHSFRKSLHFQYLHIYPSSRI